MTQNEQIVEALNCVSKLDAFSSSMGRITRRQIGCDPVELTPTQAIEILETRIRTQAIRLNQAKETLKEIRGLALAEAKEALAEAMGD